MLSTFFSGIMAFITGLFGAGDGSSSSDAVHAAPAPTEQVQEVPAGQNTGEDISREDALAIAYEHAGVTEAQVTHIDDLERDSDDGRRLWEIEFIADGYEHEFDIDARTGAILDYERDREGSRDGNRSGAKNQAPAPQQQERISMDRAIEIALGHAGVTNPKWDDRELDSDDGRLYYELEFEAGGFEYEYDIDAYTGEILDVEKEWDD